MEPTVEIISFQEPLEGQVIISRIKWMQSQDALIFLLRERLSTHGLIHFITASRSNGDNDEWYSYVNFYSPRVAEKVVSAFRFCPFMIEGKACVLAKKPRNLVKKGRILMLHQCHELINHYLGFNKWSSEIVYHQLEWGSSDEQVYATAVKLSFKDFEDMTVEGVGLTEAKFSSLEEKPSKLAQAQKNSKNAALLNAFSKVLLVLVYSSDLDTKPKVAVRIDSSKKDPFHYDAIWSGKQLVQVQDVEMDPENDIFNP